MPKNAQLTLSALPHTWILDLDGTVVKHNGYLTGEDEFLEGALEFLQDLPKKDKIVWITSRKDEYREKTEKFLKSHNLPTDAIIFDAPVGERILINDDKPSGLPMALSLRRKRDDFAPIEIVEDEKL